MKPPVVEFFIFIKKSMLGKKSSRIHPIPSEELSNKHELLSKNSEQVQILNEHRFCTTSEIYCRILSFADPFLQITESCSREDAMKRALEEVIVFSVDVLS